jgi:hypothetical protein
MLACVVSAVGADELRLLRAKPDPYGYPRPAPGATNVPTATSMFFQIGFEDNNTTDAVLAESVAVRIRTEDGPAVDVLGPGKRFADGYAGKVFRSRKPNGAVAVYIDGEAELQPSTTYVLSVRARSRGGAVLATERGKWKFTTAKASASHPLQFRLNLSTAPVRWHGGFFTGFCKPTFCTSASNRIPGYELMDRVRQQYPAAWSLQRDISMTGMEHQPRFLLGGLPNVVRERETRRVTAFEKRDKGMLVCVEDFFGHQQYGIECNRPLTDDYHAGDEVLIADGVSHVTAKVLGVVDDFAESRSLLVTSFEAPSGGWRIDYNRPLPKQEDPDAPGLFASGGCYLRKLRPAGTPHFYWGRIDKEWDIVHRRFGRRLVVNFVDAPGDLSVDGRNWTYPKDYVEYHEVVRAFTGHLIDRYGDSCLNFVWSVFNEPDLAAAFWRSRDFNELQKFYDYTVDAILRAFEDRGYDSDRVIVGGLEIGGIFGTRIERPVLKIFLSHCSPTATCEGALPQNAAFADRRLDGKRSRRVETLCGGTGGRGSPCDFISVHCYNASEVAAAKLIRAKQIALATDAAYYADLWVNSFESCPGWSPPPDVAAADSYLGNGYFPTWCADVARRQLLQAAADSRYAFGESVITFWPWPNPNFGGYNASTRVLAVDDDGDGRKDRQQTVAMPILHFLGLMAGMGDAYWTVPEQSVDAHVVSGLAAKRDDALRVLLYAHNAHDIQSRSKDSFELTLDLAAVPWPEVRVTEYRFDKDHNSYFRPGLKLRDRPAGRPGLKRPTPDEVERFVNNLSSDDRQAQLAAVKSAASLGDLPEELLVAAMQLYERTKDKEVRAAIESAGRQIQQRQVCYAPEEVARVQKLAELRITKQSRHKVGAEGSVHLFLTVAANGANFVVIEPAGVPARPD